MSQSHPSHHPIVVAPSLLAADVMCLGDEVHQVETAGADWLHLDIMDNHYVPNLTFGAAFCAGLQQRTSLPIDVHLMTTDPDSLITPFANAGAASITFHPDTTPHAHRTVTSIHQAQLTAGIALNPSMPVGEIEYLIEMVDLVLVMTVNPGFGGQSFIPAMLKKIADIRKRIDQINRPIRLQVDGGVDAQTAAQCRDAGADTLVAGNAIFKSNDYQNTIAEIRGNIRGN